MRRRERETDLKTALWAVDVCKYAVLSLIDSNGAPYGVPLSIVRDGDTVYFHCAMHGFKTDCIRHSPRGCMVCVADAENDGANYTVKYTSAVIRGELSEVTETAEKISALRLLCQRHAPGHTENFEASLQRYLDSTAVWRMTIASVTGKRNK